MPTRLNLPTAADDGLPLLRCSNLTLRHTQLRQSAPVSFSWKETGARTTAASHVAKGIAASLLVTIGLTNPIRRNPQRHRRWCRSLWKDSPD